MTARVTAVWAILVAMAAGVAYVLADLAGAWAPIVDTVTRLAN